ncbi:Stp1/IreP family PP2C-type Ser/Thr phosphatase [Atopobacter phocae]|uniref:Stp1/IreP family PP2C-type Ser/Thr phosphatase n=1 Tax=Atopobacter phocae TaxID=136492 RepID=UPI000470BEBE|nr:Stp1/IreP family PP2C-type Ser/Thr phosphatase [Atopobacter phocae]
MSVYFKSDVGKRRPNNEDNGGYIYNQKNQLLTVVCDGVGGEKSGEVASQLVVKSLKEAFEPTQFNTIEEAKSFIINIVKDVNHTIYERAQTELENERMGTTMVVAIIIGQQALILNVGDSRAYLYRDEHMNQLTEDHSYVNELMRTGEITKEEAEVHPQKNYITRSMGLDKDVEVDEWTIDLHDAKWLLLCSDGLTNMLNDQIIEHILANTSSDEWTEALVHSANEAGGRDNITVLIVDQHEWR